MARAACVGDNTLAAYAEGLLEQGESRPIESHVAQCDECRRALARARAVASLSRPSGVSQGDASSAGAPSQACSTPRELRPGARVSRYLVERLIGRGAMGAVYAARDPDLDRTVAIKILCADATSGEPPGHLEKRLLREAQAMARLSHPGVISVYDVGALGDQLFIAMEFVEGGTLREWRAAQPRTVPEILAVYGRAGAGLAAAHEAGLVHRDFKPDNVLVGVDGRVRVTDFGLARADRPPESGSGAISTARPLRAEWTTTLTRSGLLLGTPAYMAPEQLRGLVADPRSDVFGFCVALYEALYGSRPFAGTTVGALRAAVERSEGPTIPDRPPVPAPIRRLLQRGLRADPNERFSSMRGVVAILDEQVARRAWSLRRRVAAAALGAVTVLAVVGGAAGRVRSGHASVAQEAVPVSLVVRPLAWAGNDQAPGFHSAPLGSSTTSSTPVDETTRVPDARTSGDTESRPKTSASPARTHAPQRPSPATSSPGRSIGAAARPMMGDNGSPILPP